MIRTQIQLTDRQLEALRALAAREERSIASIIRELVDGRIEAAPRADRESLRRRARAAVGRFHSGARDLSSKHDDHLAEAYGR